MTNTFSIIIAENYNEIIRNFRIGLKAKGYEYDEDLINDAFISCYNTIKDREITKSEAIKYYWAAYINKYKTKLEKEKYIEFYEDMTEFEDIAVEKYNNSPDLIYNMIIKELQDKFGVRKIYEWELYITHEKTSKEIKNMGFGDIENFAYFTKQVKRYIKNHIIVDNKELYEIIKYRKDC